MVNSLVLKRADGRDVVEGSRSFANDLFVVVWDRLQWVDSGRRLRERRSSGDEGECDSSQM